MSISDKIVCMSTAKVQQIGSPMELYLAPKNEFVAKFLGMPEMTIFEADVKGGKIYVEKDNIASCPKSYSKSKIHVGFRSESLIEDEEGKFVGELKVVEYLGKEIKYIEETVEEAYESRKIWKAEQWKYDSWVSTYTAISENEQSGISNDIEKVLGRKATSLTEYLKKIV